MTESHDRRYEIASYTIMLVLTIAQNLTDKIPLQVNVACFSLACIVAGSYRSTF